MTNYKFSEFFNRFQPNSTDEEEKMVSPGHPTPVNLISPPPAHVQITEPSQLNSPKRRARERHIQQYASLLSTPIVNLDKIREISWNGIPPQYRARVWRLFLDYEPIDTNATVATLEHKRKDYFDCLSRLYGEEQKPLWTSAQKQMLHQISIDLPRTVIPLLRNEKVNHMFEHVLFVWAVRHPASGYVQGMNDILLPFFFTFTCHYYPNLSPDVVSQKTELNEINNEQLKEIEADSFWCFSKLMDGIQDVFTKDQPGLFRMVDTLEQVVQRVDPTLFAWVQQENIKFREFTFRWMNCLLVREFSLPLLLRLWDLYISNHTQISSTQVYVCAAMLEILSPELVQLHSSDFIMKLQTLGPDYWSIEQLETILAQAFVYEKTFSFPPDRKSVV